MVQVIYQFMSVVDGLRLSELPRFNLRGKALVIGPYDSAESHDLHLAETYGSGDPFLDTTDEIRFSPITSCLVSCRFGVPERPTANAAFVDRVAALPPQRGLPALNKGTPFQVVIASHTHIDPAGRALTIFDSRQTNPVSRIELAPDLELVTGTGTISGVVLHNPARYLTRGWAKVEPLADDGALGPLLAAYVNLIDENFVARMDDADPNARGELVAVRDAVRAVAPSPQADVLIDAVDAALDTFWGT